MSVRHFYNTPAYRAWRYLVVHRAAGRCEAVDRGMRCTKAMPDYRMYADHIIELQDGGAPLDLDNGQCLCAMHHIRKTQETQTQRLAAIPF